MARLNGLKDFVQREMFYIAVILFDVFALGVLVFGPPGKETPGEREAVRRLAELDKLLSPSYLEWAARVRPHAVAALTALVGGFLFLTIVGLILLGRAGIGVARGKPALKQQPLLDARWSAWDVLKIAAVYPFLVVGGYSVLAAFGPHRALFHGAGLMAGLGVNYFAFAGTLFLLWRIVRVERGQSLRELGYSLGEGLTDLGRVAGCYAAFCPLFLAASKGTQMVTRLFGIKTHIQDVVPVFVSEESWAAMAAMIILACLVAPVVEETFFRGFLQPVLRRWVGTHGAIMGTAVVFALVHRNVSVFLPVLVLGVVLGYLYEKTQSTIASATLHALHNTVTTCFLLIIRQLPVAGPPHTIV